MFDKTITVPFTFKKDILAVGGQVKNTFCLGRGKRAYVSQPFGDLETAEALSVFEKAIIKATRRRGIKPRCVVCDMHPEYLSTKYANDYAILISGSRLIPVQHHHAHIASVMAENGMKNKKVIGVAFDGSGFGSDGTLWGGEFLIADYRSFVRLAHFEYMPLIGAAQAIREPWRVAVAYLYKTFGESFLRLNIDFVKRLDKRKWRILESMLAKGINAPLTSSAGRLFDAVSSLTGIRDVAGYEGEAAVELEKVLRQDGEIKKRYQYNINRDRQSLIIDVKPMIRGIVSDLKRKVPSAIISYAFHATIVDSISDVCKEVRKKTGINSVVLSGGVFHNRFISKRAQNSLRAADFRVFAHRALSPGDAALSLGQAAVAAHQRAG